MKNNPLITQMAIVTPWGDGVDEMRRGLFSKEPPIRDLRGWYVPREFPVVAGGIISTAKCNPKLEYDKFRNSAYDRFSELLLRLLTQLPSNQVYDGIFICGGPTQTWCDYHLEPENFLTEQHIEALVLKHLKEKGSSLSNQENFVFVATTCVSGLTALGWARDGIRFNHWSRVLIIGIDLFLEQRMCGLYNLGALISSKEEAKTLSRPFSKNRGGFVGADGVGALILESPSSASQQESSYEVCGYSQNLIAEVLTGGQEDGSILADALEFAVKDAGWKKNEIDFLKTHGTSTLINDRQEVKSLEIVFGESEKKPVCSSFKGILGHTLNASGVVETIATILVLEKGIVPAMPNYIPDPNLNWSFHEVDVVLEESKKALMSASGFGGHNACIAIEKRKLLL